jgi:hypothetical protein
VWIDRSLADRLVGAAQHFPALLVTGARQTGKTSILRHTFPAAPYVSLDLPSAAQQAEDRPGEFLGAWSVPVIIDEVQYAPALFRHLKIAIDRDRHAMGRFLMTGSQKFGLMQAVSDSLAGRCAVLELDTLSSREIRGGLGRKSPPDTEIVWRGGFPELYRNPDIPPRDFFSSYVATFIERDVRLVLQVGNLRDFERFVRACALRSGQLLNLADLARDVGVAGTTARDWLSVLDAANQVVILEPYFGNVTKRLIKTPKLYLRDTGLLCFLLGIDSATAMERSPFIGAIWETFVLGQILRARDAIGSAARVHFWRDAHGTEVDFAIEHQGHVRLVEAKWAEHVDPRVLLPLRKVRDLLGARAATEHWVVCRTAHRHGMAGHPDIVAVDGVRFSDWIPT